MIVMMGCERLVRGWKDERWWRCLDEKCWEEGRVMNEGSYASRCVVMMAQLTLLCVGLGLTPAYV